MSACLNPTYCGTGDADTLCDNCRPIAEAIGVTITRPCPPAAMEKDHGGTALVGLDAQFRNLEGVANVLSLHTDALGDTFKAIEERLKRLGLGLICWLTIDKHPNQASLHIGYGQIDNKRWGLMAKLGNEIVGVEQCPPMDPNQVSQALPRTSRSSHESGNCDD